MREGEISKSINTLISMVKHIIRADILRVAWKNTSNEQNVCSYYMLNHRIRGLLFQYKKSGNLQLASSFLVRVFRNILIPSVTMMLTMSKIFGRIICQTIK